ncbi:TIGR01777 family protein [Flavobacterium sp. SOK18b]|uniref:TIGR01777 family oxidoreductase n=1 Tax=Flavobacterium sp. SOK18b TaxID=797900 RepID=UPI0015F99111|nr:TIGR01777 family oxidoreductase [Flavobacterium sp. SOK18b]MBB1192122.1 TIGR01777 family protein [Flavobacterium sp. SOK18b]
MKKNVLISGGTGFIGRQLTTLLLSKGFTVSILTRTLRPNLEKVFYYKWDVENQTIDEQAVLRADFIIHLAGENIAEKRWTAKRKAAIIESREQSTLLLYTTIKKHNKKLDAFISASAVGIYGAVNGEEICEETMLPENDFLGYTCQKWEDAIDFIENRNIRTVKLRTGLVLGKKDGVLNKLSTVFKLRLGSALGTGKQYMPWIHVDDLCEMYFHAMQNETMNGAYNAAIQDNTTNTIFSKTLACVYGYAIWLPNVPVFVLEFMMGEMSKIVLTGRRVSSEKIEQTGFQFQFKNLEGALRNCLTK